VQLEKLCECATNNPLDIAVLQLDAENDLSADLWIDLRIYNSNLWDVIGLGG
jgi:hypothetical protein